MNTRSVAVWVGVTLTGALLGIISVPAHSQREGVASGTGIAPDSTRWSGWVQFDVAYAWPTPAHFANIRSRGELAGRGDLAGGAKWKLSARASYDGAYDRSDHFPPGVRADQRSQLVLHEAYVDFSRGDWEFRLGKQNIVWGEMVGLFFADVVSAKDLREYVLPEFDQIRIPQWAVRAERFSGDSHLELVWLPAPAIDLIGEPGAEFYPAPAQLPGFGYLISGEAKPSRSLSNSGYGFRVSTLASGWDLAVFAYRGPDPQATFHRSLVSGPIDTVLYEGRHDRITRLGATFAKDFDGIVARAEVVHTTGRRFAVTDLNVSDGTVGLKTLDWVGGIELTPAERWRVNAQFFQRRFLDHDPRIGLARNENGASLLVAYSIANGLDAEMLAITSLVRSDRLLRTTVTWKDGARTRVRLGVDAFSGTAFGLFGRFGHRDRVWGEYRYNF